MFGALTAEDISEESSEIGTVLRNSFSLRRKPSLGTGPEVYYIL
jgi:molybdopterin-containing oxidoreductase family iron-sulfur binding subunit